MGGAAKHAVEVRDSCAHHAQGAFGAVIHVTGGDGASPLASDGRPGTAHRHYRRDPALSDWQAGYARLPKWLGTSL